MALVDNNLGGGGDEHRRWQEEKCFANLAVPQLQEHGSSYYAGAKALLERVKSEEKAIDILAVADGPCVETTILGGERSNRKSASELKLEKFHALSRHNALLEIEAEIKRVSKDVAPHDTMGERALRKFVEQVGHL